MRGGGGTVFRPCFVMQYLSVLSSFAIIGAGCFTVIVFLMSFAVSQGTVGWSAMYDCVFPGHTHLHFNQ